MAGIDQAIYTPPYANIGLDAIRKMMGGGFIKFDPEKITSVGQNIEQQQRTLAQTLSKINKKAEGLMSSWEGGSANLYIEKMRELNIQGEELSKQLLILSQDLFKVSGVYKAGETQATQKAESLPTDGVFRV